MSADPQEPRIPVTAYPEKSLLDWIDNEAFHAGRSRTKQIEHFLRETRASTEWNRKAAMEKAKLEQQG